METINISTLKAHLSEILQKVKSGMSFVVYDRKTPVATLRSMDTSSGLRISKPAQRKFKPPRQIITRIKIDPVSYLLEDRRKR